jgi:hypothetical protein
MSTLAKAFALKARLRNVALVRDVRQGVRKKDRGAAGAPLCGLRRPVDVIFRLENAPRRTR